MQKPPESERFLAAFDDPTIFDCGQFNLLKVAQDALLRELGSDSSKRIYFTKPRWFLKTYFALKALAQGGAKKELNLPALAKRKWLVLMPLRFVEGADGKKQQQYLGNLFPHIPSEEMVLYYQQASANFPVPPDLTKPQVDRAFGARQPNREEWKFLKDLQKCYAAVAKNSRFTPEELNHIKFGFDEFWQKYRTLNYCLAELNIQKALLIPGYYTEFFIAALSNHRIPSVEIQHGVITPASHFYIYPQKVKPVVPRALFADRIWVFGEFWKQQLLRGVEFDASQIDVLGDYFVRHTPVPTDEQNILNFSKKHSSLVLIGTQTKRHKLFKRFAQTLAKKYAQERPEVAIVLKPHPVENVDLYAGLNTLSNVLITSASLDYLYPLCQVYVSMYSNTLFESTRFGQLQRFVLSDAETNMLAEGIAESGVAQMLGVDEDPMEKIAQRTEQHAVEANHFFQPQLNTQLLEEWRKTP